MTDFNHDTPHHWFGRKWAFEAAKTFFWVSIVTILIWVYADLEKTETEAFHVKLVLGLGASGDLIFTNGTDLKRQDLEVTFRASGSRSGLDRCRRKLSELADTLTADLSAYPPGSHQVDLADILRRSELVRESGLSIVSASPDHAPVEIDRALHVPDVEVHFNSTGAGVVKATVQPPQMGLLVAKARWDELTKEELARTGAKPALETALVNLQTLPGDSNKPLHVEVVGFISRVPVLPDRTSVDVDLKISQMTAEEKLRIPVRVQSPPGWAEDDTWQRFVLKREDPLGWQKEITFRGPQKEIEKLRPEDVDAYVVLREDDKTKTEAWLKRDVEVRLPRDSQIQVVGEKPSVLFRLDARPAATPPP
jgi:hypothetical protein